LKGRCADCFQDSPRGTAGPLSQRFFAGLNRAQHGNVGTPAARNCSDTRIVRRAFVDELFQLVGVDPNRFVAQVYP